MTWNGGIDGGDGGKKNASLERILIWWCWSVNQGVSLAKKVIPHGSGGGSIRSNPVRWCYPLPRWICMVNDRFWRHRRNSKFKTAIIQCVLFVRPIFLVALDQSCLTSMLIYILYAKHLYLSRYRPFVPHIDKPQLYPCITFPSRSEVVLMNVGH
jgi:hypothetical protein